MSIAEAVKWLIGGTVFIQARIAARPCTMPWLGGMNVAFSAYIAAAVESRCWTTYTVKLSNDARIVVLSVSRKAWGPDEPQANATSPSIPMSIARISHLSFQNDGLDLARHLRRDLLCLLQLR